MITTSEIAPSPALAPFIRSYAYREFDTNGTDVVKPWHACHEANISFFFGELPVKLTDTKTGQILKTGKYCDVVGMSTQYNGEMTFNGKYFFLQIFFQPNGFYTLFNISPPDVSDKIIWSGDIFNSQIEFLYQQLAEAKNISAMASLADNWLLRFLHKKKRPGHKGRITVTANLIAKSAGNINLEALANYACMSMRNFERLFTYETGMSPKLLCCISRFNNALETKLSHPNITWTDLAHQSGYFDQMHLIKDFKRFCGEAPASLLKLVPLFEEKYISRVSR